MNFKQIIKSGESQTVEFKESFDREVLETAVAFANSRGGIILVGVTNSGMVRGVAIGNETLREWGNQISQVTEPTVIPELESFKFNGKEIVAIRIKEYPLKPVSFRGRCFKRVANSNRQMSPQEIAQMHLQSTGNSWDALTVDITDINIISPDQIKKYIAIATGTGRRHFSKIDEPVEILNKLELIKANKPTWAAILLFGKNPQSLLTQATIHCGRFKGEIKIIDDRLIAGTIIEQIDEVMDFIRKNINVEFVISGKPQRDEVWDYPLEALREAVINAVCHRDYSDPADVQIKIYDDTIQIWNPGGLPFDMTVEDLLDPAHSSKPRNKLIAQIFYDMGIIERYGSGIQRMIQACRRAGLPDPVFEEKFGGFAISFRKDTLSEMYLSNLGLNQRQIDSVFFVKEKGKITNREYRERYHISRQTATRDLSELVEKKLFKFVGEGRRTLYYVLYKSRMSQ